MPIFDLYHQRKQRLERVGEPEVYVYDELPAEVRMQISQIAKDSIGTFWRPNSNYIGGGRPNNNEIWIEMHRILCKELATNSLASMITPDQDIILLFMSNQDVDICLSIIELICFTLDRAVRDQDLGEIGAIQEAGDAIDEINTRLRRACVGYQYANGQLIRVDSQLIHEEVVKPALRLLTDVRFAGAEEEYLTAHKRYREGNMKDAVTWANKAFESTMKTVCEIKNWPYEKGASAAQLANVLKANGLWPDYLDASFDQLVATLKSGLPKVRNDAGAHGQGAERKQTPEYVAAYALHLAAAGIVLMGDAALACAT